MVGSILNSPLILWKRFFATYRAKRQQSTSGPNNRQDTIKDLLPETKEKQREFMYLNNKLCSNGPDQNGKFQNPDDQKKYNLLSPQ